MLLDIVILPSLDVCKVLTKKVLLASRGVRIKYIVDNVNLFHHLSLFHVKIKPVTLHRVISEVKQTIKKYRPITINSLRPVTVRKSVWYLLSGRQQLMLLNRDLVKRCSPLRSGCIEWSSSRKPNKQELKNIKLYGTKWCVGSSFRPHFTLAKCLNKQDASKVVKELGIINFSFMGSTIALCQINLDGQVTKILKRFRLR